MSANDRPVVILGAGINGAAVARELLLNGVHVVLVDIGDIASGTTAFSSRLIHGGLRYLEYGDFQLVRESLVERGRLLRLAPHFVRPLQLFIPIENRFSGAWQAMRRFLFHSAGRAGKPRSRGLWIVRMGLWLYDRFANDRSLPRRAVHRLPSPMGPSFDNGKFRWACSYYDAQIQFPERFVVALLKDGRRLAERHGVRFDLYTYHQATLNGRAVTISKPNLNVSDEAAVVAEFEPVAVINATGAWVDHTLRRLNVDAPRLIGGNKGSHLVTRQQDLKQRLNGGGVYAEAADGRPIFVLPLGDATLIGTTDLPFDGDPRCAVATDDEIEYLIAAVNQLFAGLRLSRDDIELHYCGVRPLPYAGQSNPAAVSRGHDLHEHADARLPLFSIVGGKLTTCRSLAEEVAAAVLKRMGRPVTQTTRDRPVPDDDELEKAIVAGESSDEVVRQIIRTEWVTHLSDLVERRLMWLFQGRISDTRLRNLATLLVDAGAIEPDEVESEISNCTIRLRTFYGLDIKPAIE